MESVIVSQTGRVDLILLKISPQVRRTEYVSLDGDNPPSGTLDSPAGGSAVTA